MKHINKFVGASVLVLLSLTTLNSCKNNDDSPSASSGAYGVALRAQGGSGTSSDYILQTNSLMQGEISAVGTGIEQPGWCYYMESGNALFSINYGDEGTTAYQMNDKGQLIQRGKFWVDRLDCIGDVDGTHKVGIGAPWGGGSFDCEIMVIDANKVAISSRRTDQLYRISAADTLNKWPSGATTVDKKVFVAFYPLGGASWLTPIMDTAYMSIYEYPSLKYVKTIKDTRTGPIGVYGSVPSVLKTETGDIYTFSSNSIAYGFSQTGKPSGILRVKNGETEFDQDYFLNFEEKFDGKVVMGCYIGNGKALVRYISLADDALATPGGWTAYTLTNAIFELAIVDLEAQTVTKVSDVPKHGGGFARGIYVENGKAYLSIVSSVTNEVRVYEIDPATATGKKGALVKGSELPFIYKFK